LCGERRFSGGATKTSNTPLTSSLTDRTAGWSPAIDILAHGETGAGIDWRQGVDRNSDL